MRLWKAYWNIRSHHLFLHTNDIETKHWVCSLSDKQDKIQTQMFQNIATIETSLFSVCSKSLEQLSDTPGMWHLVYDIENGKVYLLFFLKEDSIILLSLIGSRFEIYHNLMNNHHWGQEEEAERPNVSEAASLLLYPNVHTVTPSALASTLRHLQLHHSGSHPLEDKDRVVFKF